jgi:hypothetical protein
MREFLVCYRRVGEAPTTVWYRRTTARNDIHAASKVESYEKRKGFAIHILNADSDDGAV